MADASYSLIWLPAMQFLPGKYKAISLFLARNSILFPHLPLNLPFSCVGITAPMMPTGPPAPLREGRGPVHTERGACGGHTGIWCWACRQAEADCVLQGPRHTWFWTSVLESVKPIAVPRFQNSTILDAFHKIIFLKLLFWEEEASSKIYRCPSDSMVTGYHHHLFQSHLFLLDNILRFHRHIKEIFRYWKANKSSLSLNI